MSYLQIYDVDPKMCLLYDFSHENVGNSENISAIVYFFKHIYPILQENPQKVTLEYADGARIEKKTCKIDRHFPAFSFFGEHSSDFYIKRMGPMT